MNLKEQLSIFINQPYDPITNFNLALCYDEIGHTASAYSYFLRTAEFSEDDNLIYESLLKCGLCLGKQGSRIRAEKGMYLHAMNLLPNRPEAYFILTQFYENQKNWQESYNMAVLGLRTKEVSKTFTFLNYLGKWSLILQQAIAGWWCGKDVEAKGLFTKLFAEYESMMPESFKELVHNNLTFLNDSEFPFCPYTSLIHHKLRFKFNGSHLVKENYSQAYQDMFVLSMLNGKRNGTYLEIGSADPFKGNNTALLETKFDWKGVSIDIDKNEVDKFKNERKNPVYLGDATKINYIKLLEDNNFKTQVDYLQLDCDPPSVTYDILTKIPFDEYNFSVITYEHDYYADETKSYRDKSRVFLKSKGYQLIASNIAPNDTDNFEDWWVYPSHIDNDNIILFKNTNDNTKNVNNYML